MNNFRRYFGVRRRRMLRIQSQQLANWMCGMMQYLFMPEPVDKQLMMATPAPPPMMYRDANWFFVIAVCSWPKRSGRGEGNFGTHQRIIVFTNNSEFRFCAVYASTATARCANGEWSHAARHTQSPNAAQWNPLESAQLFGTNFHFNCIWFIEYVNSAARLSSVDSGEAVSNWMQWHLPFKQFSLEFRRLWRSQYFSRIV